MTVKQSETVTENLFREYYGPTRFIEKSKIPDEYGFKSKNNTEEQGFPDFFLDDSESGLKIIVEAKAIKQSLAEEQVKWYMLHNDIDKNKLKNMIGIAISGQDKIQLKVSYFYFSESNEIESFVVRDKFLTLEVLKTTLETHRIGNVSTDEQLNLFLKQLNEKFHRDNKVRSTDRALFFSGILIGLTDGTFRSTYQNILSPSKIEIARTDVTVLEAHNLNQALVDAIDRQLNAKINNLSKQISWKDQFAFIRNIDFNLDVYKETIKSIEKNVYLPYRQAQKLDILGRAYKIFLSRAGNMENKNIILTPDHIKSLMVKLARLDKNDVVIDSATGSGGFLMDAMETMINLSEDDLEKIENIKEKQLIGFEIDATLFALASSNMFLHGDGRSNLMLRNSLLNRNNSAIVNNNDGILLDYIHSLKPTKAIINPPYENNQSIEFTKQAIDFLEPNGKLIIIMPTPTLRKNSEKTLDLLKEAKLDFVIKMPLNLFSEQKRTVNTSIFGFTKTPHKKDDKVLFMNLEDDGFVSVQHKGKVDVNNTWNDIENNILNVIKELDEVDGFSEKRVIFSGDLINFSGYSVNEKADKLKKVDELFNIELGTLQSTKADNKGEYPFITASSEWKKHSTYNFENEALVYAVAASGSLGKNQYINGKFEASNLTIVLTEKNKELFPINIKFYHWFFEEIRQQIFNDLADGTSKLKISVPDFKEYMIPYFDIEIQNKFVEEHVIKLEEKETEIEELRNNLLSAIKSINLIDD